MFIYSIKICLYIRLFIYSIKICLYIHLFIYSIKICLYIQWTATFSGQPYDHLRFLCIFVGIYSFALYDAWSVLYSNIYNNGRYKHKTCWYRYRVYRSADKSLAWPGRKQARKHVRDARDFNNIETRAIKFFFLQGKAPKEIHAILIETLACFLPSRAKDLSAPLY